MLERLAVRPARNAAWAADQGDSALGMVTRLVGTALLSVAGDLTRTELHLAEGRCVSRYRSHHEVSPEAPSVSGWANAAR